MVKICELIKLILFCKTFIEFIDSSTRLGVFLFSCIEGMTFFAYVDLNDVTLFCGTRNERSAASADHCNFVIIGMYLFFHNNLSYQINIAL